MPQAKDILGVKFGRLKVIKRAQNDSMGRARWNCRCSCGKLTTVYGTSLNTGRTRSCGCLAKEITRKRITIHGQAINGKRAPEYSAFQLAKDRVTNSNSKDYHRYGARGIQFKFKNFKDFFSELGPKPSPNHSIDRINNNGHYEPGNVRWATRKQQDRNKRSNRFIVFRGKRKILTDWANDIGIDPSTFIQRLNRWPLEKALITPPLKK